MLILTRRVGEKIMIGGDIEIVVVGVDRGRCKIGVVAPRDVEVHREEILKRIISGAPYDRAPSNDQMAWQKAQGSSEGMRND